MMITETEARQKWCPFYRISGAGNLDGVEWEDNRPPDFMDFDERANCMGSACMAWRGPPKHPAIRDDVFEPAGYCGLAGPIERGEA